MVETKEKEKELIFRYAKTERQTLLEDLSLIFRKIVNLRIQTAAEKFPDKLKADMIIPGEVHILHGENLTNVRELNSYAVMFGLKPAFYSPHLHPQFLRDNPNSNPGEDIKYSAAAEDYTFTHDFNSNFFEVKGKVLEKLMTYNLEFRREGFEHGKAIEER